MNTGINGRGLEPVRKKNEKHAKLTLVMFTETKVRV